MLKTQMLGENPSRVWAKSLTVPLELTLQEWREDAGPGNTLDYFAGQLENLELLVPEEAPAAEQ